MLSSDNACYSWYYTATLWAPVWAKMIYMVFPTEGLLVMNHYTSPCYGYKCDKPTCLKPSQLHSFRYEQSSQASRWFLNEDWSKRHTCVDYNNSVLPVTFTHHARYLNMVAQMLFLL
jgi:hypothetical protein